MACWHVLTVVLVAFAITELEAVREVEGISDELGAEMSEPENPYYNEVPGFAMTAGGTKHTVTSKNQCQGECGGTCKSYSYDAKIKTCITSTEALSYDADFTLFTKALTSATAGTYRKFSGMVYRASDWATIKGGTQEECETKCNKDAKCEAFSYALPDDDQSKAECLRSGKALVYSPDFRYYEKKNVKITAAQQKAPGIAVKVDPLDSKLTDAELSKIHLAEKQIAQAAKDMKDKFDAMANSKREDLSKINTARKAKDDQLRLSKIKLKKDVDTKDEEAIRVKETEWTQQTKNLEFKFAAAQEAAKAARIEQEAKDKEAAEKAKEAAEKTLEKQKADAQNNKAEGENEVDKEFAQLHIRKKLLTEGKAEVVECGLGLSGKQRKLREDLRSAKEVGQKSAKAEGETGVSLIQQARTEAEAKKAEEAVDITNARKNALQEEDKVRTAAKESVEKRIAASAVQTAANNKQLKAEAEVREKASLKTQATADQALIDAKLATQKAESAELASKAKEEQERVLGDVKKKEAAIKAQETVTQFEVKNQEATEANEALSASQISQEKQGDEQAAAVAADAARKSAAVAEEIALKRGKEMGEKADAVAAAFKDKSEKQSADAVKQFEATKKVQLEMATKKLDDVDADLKAAKAKLNVQKDENRKAALAIREAAEKAKKLIATKSALMEKQIEAQGKTDADEAVLKVKRSAARAKLTSSSTLKAVMAAFVDSGAFMSSKRPEKELTKLITDSKKQFAIAETEATTATDTRKTTDANMAEASNVLGKATAEYTAHLAAVAPEADSTPAPEAAEDPAENNAEVTDTPSPPTAAPANQDADAAETEAPLLGASGRRLLEDASTEAEPAEEAKQDAAKTEVVAGATEAPIVAGATEAPIVAGATEAPTVEEAPAVEQDAAAPADAAGQKEATDKEKAAEESAKQVGQTRERKAKHAKTSGYRKAKDDAEKDLNTQKLALENDQQVENVKLKTKQKYEKVKNAYVAEREEVLKASLPARTAQSVVPGFENKLLLQSKNGKVRERDIFLMFETSKLLATQIVEAAHLRLYKEEGVEGLLAVKIAACGWKKSEITFDSSVANKNIAAGRDINEGPSIFPDYSKVWVDVKLNGPAIQAARSSGSKVCLRISGGPQYTPDIISSTPAQMPELSLQTYKGSGDSLVEMREVSMLDEADEY